MRTLAAPEMVGGVEVRSEQWNAWHGPALLVSDPQGECGGRSPPDLTGNTRQDRLTFSYVHPEMAGGGAGGSGASDEELPRDDRGLPRRAIDLLA
jgi:hypothetical protein